jgi:hypothetical protein
VEVAVKRHVVILAAALSTGTASDASAHHSHPYFYDQCKSITIEGRVDSVQWKDPHTLIVLRPDDGAAYTVDWNSLRALTRDDVVDSAKKTLVVGSRITVTGNPIRDVTQIREHFPDFNYTVNPRTVDPKSIRRVDGGFNWAMRPAVSTPDCGRK